MKKLITVLAIFTLSLCTRVQAQSEDVNPLNVARAFALKTPAYFNCWFQGQALVSNTWQQTTMNFIVRKSDFAITNLTINDKVIPLPKPIYGLPLGDGGIMRNVYVNASAMTKSGEYAGNGYVQMQQVSKDDQIEIILRPADVRQEIPVDVGLYGSDIRFDIDGFIYGYGYGVSDGKFYAYLPPVGGKYHYILRRWSTGEPIGEGWVEPFKDAVTPEATYFGVRYIGNVIGVDFNSTGTDDWIGVPNIQFDCSVPTDEGTNVQGKVVFTDVGSGSLELIMGADVHVFVQQVTDKGDMPFLLLEDHSVNYGGGNVETRVNTVKAKIGKVVITIIPKGPIKYGPYLNIHRYYGLPSSGGGVTVGGKEI